jgi:hypothetical protein
MMEFSVVLQNLNQLIINEMILEKAKISSRFPYTLSIDLPWIL